MKRERLKKNESGVVLLFPWCSKFICFIYFYMPYIFVVVVASLFSAWICCSVSRSQYLSGIRRYTTVYMKCTTTKRRLLQLLSKCSCVLQTIQFLFIGLRIHSQTQAHTHTHSNALGIQINPQLKCYIRAWKTVEKIRMFEHAHNPIIQLCGGLLYHLLLLLYWYLYTNIFFFFLFCSFDYYYSNSRTHFIWFYGNIFSCVASM